MAIANNQIYTTGIFNPIIDKCEGCERVIEVESQKICKTFTSPAAKWKLGLCNFATHVKPEIITSTVKVNPLKASKRAMGKR
jgi:hypothetical protein